MKETPEKYEDIQQYELEALKEIKKNLFERDEEHTRHIDLMRCTALGLTFGIGGNLFVQFLYPVVEALLLGEYTTAFAGNLILCGISLALIIFVSIYLQLRLTRGKNKLKLSRENAEVIEYAIKRRQYILEQGKKNEPQPNMNQSQNTGKT